jgi:cell division protein FtsB
MISDRLKNIPDLRRRALRFVLLVVGLAICYSFTAGNYGFLSIMETREQIAQLKYDEKTYRAKVIDLQLTKARLLSDSLYLESLARKKYRLGRPGETIIEF